jgi:hypothetical protein
MGLAVGLRLLSSEMLPLSLSIIRHVCRDGANRCDVALRVDETSDVKSKVSSCQEESRPC